MKYDTPFFIYFFGILIILFSHLLKNTNPNAHFLLNIGAICLLMAGWTLNDRSV